MASLDRVPPELLPAIIGFVISPEHIYTLCLVNSSFSSYATPLLYRHVSIYAWYKNSKHKVVALFQTLSQYPRLACHVEKLEIRDFPKALHAKSQYDLLQNCIQGVRNCINLRSCVWTRDGSLPSALLRSLCHCPLLHELEINGNDGNRRGYNPDLLTGFSRLSKLSLIMPSIDVLDILPTWVSITGNTLRALTILCKMTTFVTDTLLSQLAPNLQGLEYLTIIGCHRLTHVGIGAVASANRSGLLGIDIEGLSQSFDMSIFKTTCLHTMALRRLRAITLTIHTDTDLANWTHNVTGLLSDVPLEAFSMYSVSSSKWVRIPDEFWKGMVANHGQGLKKLSVHRIRTGLVVLKTICSQCTSLEQLFIVVEQRDLDDATSLFALARNLRVLHVSFPVVADESLAGLSLALMDKATSIASVCSPTLVHLGCNMRVWQIMRDVCLDADSGEKYVVPRLAPRESVEVPEQFLAVRA